MALTALGGMPIITIGGAGSPGYSTLIGALANVTVDATNEAVSFIGNMYWEDGGSHTVDTSGSSSLQWRSQSATFANGSTTLLVGLADVDTANGSGSPRAVNSTDVITMDVYRTLTGGGGGVANGGWNTSVPTTGTKTIAHGALVAFSIQMTARAGADTINIGVINHQSGAGSGRPAVGTYLGGSYAAGGNIPNCGIIASDGTFGTIYGAPNYSAVGTSTFNSGSSPNERGNVIVPPFAGKAVGIAYSAALAGSSSDFDLVLYSDPLGTPAAEKTVSIDANTHGTTSNNLYGVALFSSPYTFTAGQTLAAIFKPTTANNITASYVAVGNATMMKSLSLGTGAYAVNRSSGAFSVQASNTERYAIGLLVDSFSDVASSSGGGQRVFGG